jgi:hypothetical protein
MLLLLNICSHKPEAIHSPDEENIGRTITHLPFKAKVSERWGLIGVDGKVLFRNKFKNKPSYVVNGIFYVQNANERYEYYYAKEKPERINKKTYAGASLFYDDIAIVEENQGHSAFIRKDGSQAFVFDSYDDEEVTLNRWEFNDGMILFGTESGKWGYINTEGEVVIPPKYKFESKGFSEGLAAVWENFVPSYDRKSSAKKSVAYVIDKSGKKQFNLDVKSSVDDQDVWYGSFVNGLMPCIQGVLESDFSYIECYINRKGKKVIYAYYKEEKVKSGVAMPPKDTYIIEHPFNKKGYALCMRYVSDEEKSYLGAINTDGKIIIDTKYEFTDNNKSKNYYYPNYDDDIRDRYDEYKEEEHNEFRDRYENCYITEDFACISDKGKYGLIDFNGNIICPFQFDKIYPFYDGKHAFARKGGTCYLINAKGERMDKNEYEIIDDEIRFYLF